MYPHIELRLRRIIFELVIWTTAISIVNTEEKLHSDESIVEKGISESEISPKIPNIGKSLHIEIYFHKEIDLISIHVVVA